MRELGQSTITTFISFQVPLTTNYQRAQILMSYEKKTFKTEKKRRVIIKIVIDFILIEEP
jgi:hypothetical protein